MTYEDAKQKCHVRSAIYRTSQGVKYWKNHPVSLDERVSGVDKAATDWQEHDPREDDDSSVFMFND
jgi:hypothetical protein